MFRVIDNQAGSGAHYCDTWEEAQECAAQLGDCTIEIECQIHGWQALDDTSIDGGCEICVHAYHSSLI